MPDVKKIPPLGIALLMLGCSSPPPPTPSLNPEQAMSLLQFDHKADSWMTFVKKNNPACGYKINLPDQSAHPTEIDIDHIVWCGNAPSPKEFDASVVFVYDKATQRWTISRFSS